MDPSSFRVIDGHYLQIRPCKNSAAFEGRAADIIGCRPTRVPDTAASVRARIVSDQPSVRKVTTIMPAPAATLVTLSLRWPLGTRPFPT